MRIPLAAMVLTGCFGSIVIDDDDNGDGVVRTEPLIDEGAFCFDELSGLYAVAVQIPAGTFPAGTERFARCDGSVFEDRVLVISSEIRLHTAVDTCFILPCDIPMIPGSGDIPVLYGESSTTYYDTVSCSTSCEGSPTP